MKRKNEEKNAMNEIKKQTQGFNRNSDSLVENQAFHSFANSKVSQSMVVLDHSDKKGNSSIIKYNHNGGNQKKVTNLRINNDIPTQDNQSMKTMDDQNLLIL